MKIIKVNHNGIINTISKAIDQLTDEVATIYIAPGCYNEKLKIKHSNLTIIGTDPLNTIIINDDFAKKIHSDGQEYNTFRTYTMLILGNNVHLQNLQIINSSGFGPNIGQAVALETIGDHIEITNCILKSYQDTLFLGPLPEDLIERYQNFLPKDELINPINHRVLFDNCTIEGNVDFIFGGANAVFRYCNIISYTSGGYVCAPSTSQFDEFGFTFLNCTFSSDSIIPNTYLARPWREYGKSVFINCIYGKHIFENGFNKWNDTNRDKTCRFFEYQCRYIDNSPYKRIYFGKLLKEDEVFTYTVENIFCSIK